MKTSYLLLLLLVFCCTDESGLFDPSYWSTPYKGITFTDEYANIVKNDEDDWYYYYSKPLGNKLQFSILPAFPNPVDHNENQSISFMIFLPIPSDVKLYIKDRNDQLVIQLINDFMQDKGMRIQWDLKDSNGNKVYPDIYRCFIEVNGIQKHGDIWVK